jgi:hypothetical protein
MADSHGEDRRTGQLNSTECRNFSPDTDFLLANEAPFGNIRGSFLSQIESFPKCPVPFCQKGQLLRLIPIQWPPGRNWRVVSAPATASFEFVAGLTRKTDNRVVHPVARERCISETYSKACLSFRNFRRPSFVTTSIW